MGKGFKKLNNQGSTLLTIIICIALIGILGSMMLSATMTNLQMKIVESNSKKNFYTCEMAMEEIRTGIQELTAQVMKKVYEEEVLPEYASYLILSEGQKNLKIHNLVAQELGRVLGTGIVAPDEIFTRSDIVVNHEVLNTYLSKPNHPDPDHPERGYTDLYPSYLSAVKSTYIDNDGDGNPDFSGASIVLTELKVEYTEGDYQTSITSDIRVTLPKFTFTSASESVHFNMVQPFQDYVLVADNSISANNTYGKDTISGNVYAGENGIDIKNNLKNGNYEVNMSGDHIVTRGNIKVSDTAKLIIGNLDGSIDSHNKPMVWANNLVTQTTGNSYPSHPTILQISGISIIKDDLVLDGINSQVTMNGAYIGYTGLHSEKGSAVMINGTGSSLLLSGLSPLVLAGRAHINVEDGELNKDSDILTGESVALKSNQRAYLIPGKFIEGIEHNPVTEADIMSSGVLVNPVVTIENDTDINYLDFVAGAVSPFQIAVKQSRTSSGSSLLRYYYLNFGSGKQADDYMMHFYGRFPELLDQMAPFTLGNVTVPTAENYSVGNVMSYPDTTDGSDKTVVLASGLSETLKASYPDDASLDAYIANISLNAPIFEGTLLDGNSVRQLGGLYKRMSNLLTLGETATAYQEDHKVVASGMVRGGIRYFIDHVDTLEDDNFDYIKKDMDYTFYTTGSPKQTFAVVDGDVIIDENAFLYGILIASGNITIEDGATIHGMVISTGETNVGNIIAGNHITVKGRLAATNQIILGTESSFEINETIENNYIAPIFQSKGDLLSNLFHNADTTVNFTALEPVSSLVDISMSGLISYENWRKNE
ncbi:MAG: hypothetical protein K0S76_1322 [Herbinix sp.]|jgi:type II secretory pathway pseudopilin PulG|nr:hypothetical protein [Herbinix sp.]